MLHWRSEATDGGATYQGAILQDRDTLHLVMLVLHMVIQKRAGFRKHWLLQ